jgi:hypothetical protein
LDHEKLHFNFQVAWNTTANLLSVVASQGWALTLSLGPAATSRDVITAVAAQTTAIADSFRDLGDEIQKETIDGRTDDLKIPFFGVKE